MTTEKERQRLDLRDSRVRDDEGAGFAMAYQADDGVDTLPLTGDREFAFFKDPPATTPAVIWRSAAIAVDAGPSGGAPPTLAPDLLPLAVAPADLEVLESVDTRGFRTLNLLSEFYPLDPGAPADTELYLVLEAGMDLPQNAYQPDGSRTVFAPVGVVDPTLQGLVAPLSLNPPCMVFRDVYASQFNLSGLSAVTFTPGGVDACLNTLVFDVSPYEQVRLAVGASNATSTAAFYYTLGR